MSSFGDIWALMEDPSPGKRLGNYEILELLGRGGMGVVLRARDVQLDREVALKILSPTLLESDMARQRFLQEARAVARLNHPSIVALYHFGEEQGAYYFAMEYVKGKDLSQLVKEEGKLPVDQTLRIIRETAEGLNYAWEQGVLHRDVKPSNLILSQEGKVKITDFGLSKILGSDLSLTQTQAVVGSPNFMSPEQAEGKPVDFRTDLYSLGITFYTLVTGEPPYHATQVLEVMMKHIKEPLPEPPELKRMAGGTILAMIKRMTAKNPQERFKSYHEFIHTLKELQESFHAPTVVVRRPEARRRTWKLFLFAGVLLMVLVALGIWLGREEQESSSTSLPPEAAVEAIEEGPVVPPTELDVSGAEREAFFALLREFKYKELQELLKHREPGTRRMEMARRLAEFLAQMKGELMAQINARQPIDFPGPLQDRRILSATADHLLIEQGGQQQTMAWSQLRPQEFSLLMRELLPSERINDLRQLVFATLYHPGATGPAREQLIRNYGPQELRRSAMFLRYCRIVGRELAFSAGPRPGPQPAPRELPEPRPPRPPGPPPQDIRD